MATVAGGLFDNTSVDATQGSTISSFLDSLGLTESSITQVQTTNALLYNSTTTVGGTSSDTTVVVPTSTASSSVTSGSASLSLSTSSTGSASGSSTGTSTTFGLQASSAPLTPTDTNSFASSLADQRVNTSTTIGSATNNSLKAAVQHQTANLTGNTNVAVVDVKSTPTVAGAPKTTVNLANNDSSGNHNLLVVNTSASQATGDGSGGVDVHLSGYSNVVGVGANNFVLDTASQISTISFTGTATVVGSSGSDTILGGAGDAHVTGGDGGDAFTWNSNDDFLYGLMSSQDGHALSALSSTPNSHMTIADFNAAQGDTLHFNIAGVTNFDELKAYMHSAKQVGADVVAVLQTGDTITLTGVDIHTLTQDMFTFG